MKINCLFVLALFTVSFMAWADEPDDSGIGGTGRGDVPDVEAFEAPDILEGLDIPLPTDDIPDFGSIDDADDLEVDVITAPED